MSYPADLLMQDMYDLILPSYHFNSVMEVYGSSQGGDGNVDMRAMVRWSQEQVHIFEGDPLLHPARIASLVQLMQAAHFLFHRLHEAGPFEHIISVGIT